MITINDIRKKYDFPLIDFKFQNTGEVTAILSEFNIIIKDIILDVTPLLKFSYDVKDNSLIIYAENNGYGKAVDCSIQIRNEKLEQIFPSSALIFRGNILSNKKQRIIKISYNSLYFEKLSHLLKLKDKAEDRFLFKRETKDELKIGEIQIEWQYLTETKEAIKGIDNTYRDKKIEEYPRTFIGEELYLSTKGFCFYTTSIGHISYCIMGPTQIYCVMLDIDKGKCNRKYSVSRMIAPSDVDRFHIMIGATKSAQIDLEFNFKVDLNYITSDEFRINIFNPINNRLSCKYIDGDVTDFPLFKEKSPYTIRDVFK